ncbi:MAG: FkbM family methyltransferase [Thermoleophilaceae bacterium]
MAVACARALAPGERGRARDERRRESKALRKHLRQLDRRLEKMNGKLETVYDTAAPLAGARLQVGRLDYAKADIYLKLGSKAEVLRLRAPAKEPWTVQWIETWLRPGETLYDVGANVGAYSLVAARQHGGSIRVVAFEPGFATFASLCENVILNDLTDSVVPLPLALGGRSELSSFTYSDVRAGAARHTLGEGGEGAVPYRQPLLTHRLDDLVERYSLTAPNHLKIDVDGPELAVLEGAEETLRSPGLRSLMIEVNADQKDPIESFLAERGWPVHAYFRPTWKDPVPEWPVYVLFARET